ncbi:MAG: hypothetical protein IPL43_00110 [Micropruina sp.]|nr:hypothetical protein [Micropruina sp.]
MEQYGDATKYPRIFNANKGLDQPGGQALTDPDNIDVGWTLTIPGVKMPGSNTEPVPQDRVPAVPRSPATTTTARAPEASPASTAAPTQQATTLTQEAPSAGEAAAAADQDPAVELAAPGWLLSGLAGAGSLLAGALWLALRGRRASQSRARRPGRAISPPPPAALAPVEKTLIHQGIPTADTVITIHDTLRRLANRLINDIKPLPALTGLDVTPEQLTLHLTGPADLPAPWQPGADSDTWTLDTGQDADTVGPLPDPDSPAPWPQLVTLGADEQGWRLVNLEQLGTIHLGGDPLYADDLARYLISELAISPWARDLRIDCLSIGDELAGLSDRIWHHTNPTVIDDIIAAAVTTADRLTHPTTPSLDTARARQDGDHQWDSRLLITTNPDTPHLNILRDLMVDQPGRTATTLITVGAANPTEQGVEILLTADGRLQLPQLGLDLVPTGLTRAEALGCVAVLAAADNLNDITMPSPEDATQEWEGFANDAGQLRPEHTLPRDSTEPDTVSLLPDPDPAYLAHTANTTDDLASLAPRVPATLRARVETADPTLDADLAAWHADSGVRPRLTVLGGIRVRVGTSGHPVTAAARFPYYAEVIAYLATRPHGATTAEMAEALGISPGKVRRDASVVRAWLGPNPRTGMPYLPEATKHPQAIQRGVGLYIVDDLLSDADLFRRLRVRGESRGPDGIPDLLAALRLVTGKPYDNLRARGGAWLTNTRTDQHLLCGIVDVAHIVTTHALTNNNIRQARAAAELAALAAPDETTPRLDLAAIAAHEGRPEDAHHIAKAITNWRDTTTDTPAPLPERAETILKTHRWLEPTSRAS